MPYNSTLTTFAQSVYLTIKNRYFDDIEEEDGQTFIAQVIDWTNMLLDELETLVDASGRPVEWSWMRQMDYELGTAVKDEHVLSLDTTVNSLIYDPNRVIRLSVDDKVVSRWTVVAPGRLDNREPLDTQGMVTRVGDELIFSRDFTDTEDGGTVTGDVVISLPRLSAVNQNVLKLVKPKQLLVLGVAKNATLPDIVQGGLSPSYVQKYNDLLQSAIVRNGASNESDNVDRDNYSYISGVGL